MKRVLHAAPKRECNPPPLVEVNGVDFSYGRLQVLFDVSLHVEEGEALALLGTNGAGKSTLLRLLSGLEVPSAGTISYAGSDISAEPAERLVANGLALISGGHAVFADLSVRENLDIFCVPIRKDKARVRERMTFVLDTFPALPRRLGTAAGRLSGGEQQQLALAKALLLDPKVLCIDELSLGLAPIVVAQLMGIVRSLHQGGLTLIVVEQSLSVACQLCARAVFMEKGQIRFEGPTADLLERDDIARAVFLGGHRDGAQNQSRTQPPSRDQPQGRTPRAARSKSGRTSASDSPPSLVSRKKS